MQELQPDISSERHKYLQSAKVLLENNDFQLAKNILGKLITDKPDDVDVLYLLSEVFQKSGETDSSIKCLQNIHQINSDVNAVIELGKLYFQIGNFHKCEIYLQEALDDSNLDDQQLFDCFKYLGNVFVKQQDLTTAEEYYNKALRLFPRDEQLFINYASLYIQQGAIEKAKNNFQLALEVNPRSSGAWTGLALIYRSINESQLFWATVKNAIEADPFNKMAVQLVADSAILDAEYEFAIKVLSNYLTKNPEDFETNIHYACVLFQAGKIDECLWEVRKVQEFVPEHPDLSKLLTLIGS